MRTVGEPRGLSLARTVAALGLVVGMIDCGTPVGVTRVSGRQVHQSITANVLSTGEASSPSVQLLHRANLSELFRSDPEAALSTLHAALLEDPTADNEFALAELSFLHAERTGKQSYYLAAAIYARLFLVQWRNEQVGLALDPRFRLVADIYNRGLTSGFMSEDGEEVLLAAGRYPLPFGEMQLSVDESQFEWGGFRMTEFVPVAELEVRGLATRYRQPGLGMPLAASLTDLDHDQLTPGREFIPKATKVTATALVRFPTALADLRKGKVQADLLLYTMDEVRDLPVGGGRLPLEYEPSAALAYSLADSPFWTFELRGFFSGDFGASRGHGLIMVQPYHPGRIPLVLVHGTASSPGRWADLVNDLYADPFVFEHFQVWFFQYNTGNPIAYSAGLLREALEHAVTTLDPNGTDPALHKMVIVGHSQGGLLAKLTVVDSGTLFWDNLSDEPFDQVELTPATRESFERSVFFEALPFVDRVIFIATPHRGSFQTQRPAARLISALVSFPNELVNPALGLVSSEDSTLRRSFDELPSSIDDMTPNSPFLIDLSEMPIADGVISHSIIAVRGGGPFEDGNDGVVEYRSAHIDGVASEFIVPSGHSTQSHPLTIREVRRILHEHAGSTPPRPSTKASAPY